MKLAESGCCSRLGGGRGLFECALDLQGLVRQFLVAGLEQEGIEPANMINAAQSLGGNAELEIAAQLLRSVRSDAP